MCNGKSIKEAKICRRGMVKLLWTGGWDSTFRLIELSGQKITIQPIYLFGDGRKSERFERRAMTEIQDLLWKHPQTKAEILPLECVDIATIPQNLEITNAYNRIISKYPLGSQYEWISRYALRYPECELCVEKSDESYMLQLIDATCDLISTGDVHCFKVISRQDDVRKILGNVYFPIINKTETEMTELIRSWGYEDVMRHIWFCHSPIKKGETCGFCRPCQEKMASDMSFLLSEGAIKRYALLQKHGDKNWYKFYKRLYYKINQCRN